MAKLVTMKFLRNWDDHRAGDIVHVSRSTAGLLEMKGLAVRLTRPRARTKPITDKHSVNK